MSMDPTKQHADQMFELYKNIQELYKRSRSQLQRTILKIRDISSDIRDLERRIKKGSITTSSVRVASGVMTFAGILGAPFTFGGSLSLTAVGTIIGLGSEAVNISQKWKNSSVIKSKCHTALMLLEVNGNLTAELNDQIQKLRMIQTRIPYAALGALAYTEGSVQAISISRNIPKMKLISTKIGPMVGPSGSLAFLSATFISTGKTISPMAANVVAGVAKESLRVMGGAAVGFDILTDILKMVENVKAIDQSEFPDLLIALDCAANEMEDEMKRLDELYGSDTPSSV